MNSQKNGARTVGVDFGRARIGVAVSDELGLMAHPRPWIDGSNIRLALAAFKELVEKEGIERFIVGLPRTLDGREGTSARRVRRFVEHLERATGVPVELVDEWLSTREAQGKLRANGLDERKSRDRIDSAAAAVILQSWLDKETDRGG